MKCKNCKHPIAMTTKGWSHIDKYKQPIGICSRPSYEGETVMCCNCKNPEPIIIK